MSEIKFTEEQIDDIVQSYTVQNMTVSKIAKKYKVSNRVIARRLKQRGIEIRYNGFYYQKEFDKDFFETIDCEKKAYWLGFIYADGYITNKKTFGIKLSIKDVNHLELFKQDIHSSHKIGIYTNTNGYGKGNQYCMIAIANDKMISDLNRCGVVKNKTLTIKFPDENVLPEEFQKDFIRGYFDGDGSVYLSNGAITVSFTGNEYLLQSIRGIICNKIGSTATLHKYPDKNAYDFKIGGRNMVYNLYQYLYKDANTFLGRKKNIFDEFFNE